jgi:hypothetical protein
LTSALWSARIPEHAVSVHGHEDTPELLEQIRELLEPAETYAHEPREKEPLPG